MEPARFAGVAGNATRLRGGFSLLAMVTIEASEACVNTLACSSLL